MDSTLGARHAVGPRELFIAFLGIGLSGFGGVLPWARRVLVERMGWLTAEDFNDVLALCQSLPGPNIVNLSVVVGGRFAGGGGAFAAFVGLIGAPVAIVIGLAVLYERFGEETRVSAAIATLGAVACGMVVVTAGKMAAPLLRRNPVSTSMLAAATFCTVGVLRAPLPLVLIGLVPIGAAISWFRQNKGGKL